jgi:hypothetical protein
MGVLSMATTSTTGMKHCSPEVRGSLHLQASLQVSIKSMEVEEEILSFSKYEEMSFKRKVITDV